MLKQRWKAVDVLVFVMVFLCSVVVGAVFGGVRGDSSLSGDQGLVD